MQGSRAVVPLPSYAGEAAESQADRGTCVPITTQLGVAWYCILSHYMPGTSAPLIVNHEITQAGCVL